jgi:hypothetical protein
MAKSSGNRSNRSPLVKTYRRLAERRRLIAGVLSGLLAAVALELIATDELRTEATLLLSLAGCCFLYSIAKKTPVRELRPHFRGSTRAVMLLAIGYLLFVTLRFIYPEPRLDPLILVRSDAPLDQRNPLLVPFVFSNRSELVLEHYLFKCTLESVRFANQIVVEQVVIEFTEATPTRVEPGEDATRFCEPRTVLKSMFPLDEFGAVEEADISLFLSFWTPSKFFRFRIGTDRHEHRFRFVTVPGNPPRWIAQPWAQR